MCTSVKDLEDAKSYLSDIQKRLADIEKEIENECELDYGKLYRKLEKIEDEIAYNRDQLSTFERNNGDLVKSEEKVKGLYDLCDRAMETLEDLRNEISGDSNRETIQMMFPNDDIDSGDFEGGLDMYNKI